MGRIKNRLAAVVAVALFIVLAGTGAGYAYWSSAAAVSGSVRAGAISISQSGFGDLGVEYTDSVDHDFTTITLRNNGSITAPFSLSLAAVGSDELARAIDVWVWPVSAPSECTAESAVQGPQFDWITIPVQSGTLAASEVAVYCVRTSVTAADLENNQGRSITAMLSATSALGSWSAAALDETTQSVASSRAPSAPTASRTSGYSTSLSWTPVADTRSGTSYDVYRDDTVIATVASSSYSDESLAEGREYTYRIAEHGSASARSAPTTVTTLPVSSTAWYRVIGRESGKCIDAWGAVSTDGTPITIYQCHGNSNQQWRFVPTDDGYYKVVTQMNEASGWTVPDGNTKVQLFGYAAGSNQQWRIEREPDSTFQFVLRSTGQCFDVEGNQTADGTLVQRYDCNHSSAQQFRLAAS